MSTSDMPNVIMTGHGRTASTALCEYFKQHPAIAVTRPKEPCFFVRPNGSQVFKGHAVYRDSPAMIFDEVEYRAMVRAEYDGGAKVVIDGSRPYFSEWEVAIPNILKYCGREVAVILGIRHPAERLISHFCLMTERGLETLPLARALEQEEERRQDNWHYDYLYMRKSVGADALTAYIDTFPKLKLYLFQDFKADVKQITQEIGRWITDQHGLEPRDYQTQKKINATGQRRWPRNPCKWIGEFGRQRKSRQAHAMIGHVSKSLQSETEKIESICSNVLGRKITLDIQ